MLKCKEINGFYHHTVGDTLGGQLTDTTRQDQPTVLLQSFTLVRSLALSDGDSRIAHTIDFDLISYLEKKRK